MKNDKNDNKQKKGFSPISLNLFNDLDEIRVKMKARFKLTKYTWERLFSLITKGFKVNENFFYDLEKKELEKN